MKVWKYISSAFELYTSLEFSWGLQSDDDDDDEEEEVTEDKDGKIKPCEILDDSIGNVINDNDISAIFTSNKAKKLRKEIIDTKCKCTYECAMSTNALFSWPMTKKYFGLILGKNKI